MNFDNRELPKIITSLQPILTNPKIQDSEDLTRKFLKDINEVVKNNGK